MGTLLYFVLVVLPLLLSVWCLEYTREIYLSNSLVPGTIIIVQENSTETQF